MNYSLTTVYNALGRKLLVLVYAIKSRSCVKTANGHNEEV